MVQIVGNSTERNPQPNSFLKFGGRLVANALDLLYPPQCGGCHKWGVGLWCASCDRAVIRFSGSQAERELITEKQSAITAVSAALFGATLREGIHAFKYNATPGMATPFAVMMAPALGGVLARFKLNDQPLLVPVPLHSGRQRERGYNQSEVLARSISINHPGLRVCTALVRTRSTRQQARLTPDERRQNVIGAFSAGAREFSNQSIILIDDVLTSGATLCECADALITAGARQVVAFTLARADM